MALSSRFDEMSATLGRRDEIYALAEEIGQHLVRYGIAITMGELSRAVNDCAETVSGSRFAAELMDLFKESTMERFMALVRKVAEESKINVPDSGAQVTSVKSCYMLGGYIPTLRDVSYEKGSIKEP